jgi:hypothetical protein
MAHRVGADELGADGDLDGVAHHRHLDLPTPGDAVPANQQQAEAWKGPESAHFVDNADRCDRQLESFNR